jgi:hypothetical protein
MVLGCLAVYSALFGTGGFIYGNVATGVVCTLLCLGSGVILVAMLSGTWRSQRT